MGLGVCEAADLEGNGNGNGNSNGNVHNAHPSMTSTHTYELTDAPCEPENVHWNSILITKLLCSHHRSLVDSEDFQHEKHLVLR